MPRVTIPQIVPLLKIYYAQPDPPGYPGAHGMGGVLHIVLEDGNVEDHWGSELEATASEWGDRFGLELVRVLFKHMSRSQRYRLYRDYSFYP